jgi:hypothetical protein
MWPIFFDEVSDKASDEGKSVTHRIELEAAQPPFEPDNLTT